MDTSEDKSVSQDEESIHQGNTVVTLEAKSILLFGETPRVRLESLWSDEWDAYFTVLRDAIPKDPELLRYLHKLRSIGDWLNNKGLTLGFMRAGFTERTRFVRVSTVELLQGERAILALSEDGVIFWLRCVVHGPVDIYPATSMDLVGEDRHDFVIGLDTVISNSILERERATEAMKNEFQRLLRLTGNAVGHGGTNE